MNIIKNLKEELTIKIKVNVGDFIKSFKKKISFSKVLLLAVGITIGYHILWVVCDDLRLLVSFLENQVELLKISHPDNLENQTTINTLFYFFRGFLGFLANFFDLLALNLWLILNFKFLALFKFYAKLFSMVCKLFALVFLGYPDFFHGFLLLFVFFHIARKLPK